MSTSTTTTTTTKQQQQQQQEQQQEANNMASAPRIRRRRCKFIGTWLSHKQFATWLTPVRGDDHKAYCALCDKVFSVAHGGLHDVRAHWKGKRHIGLQATIGNADDVPSQSDQVPSQGAGHHHHHHHHHHHQQLLLQPSQSQPQLLPGTSYQVHQLLLERNSLGDLEFSEQENKLVVRQKLDGKEDGSAKSNSSNYGGDSLWLKGDLEELFEAEDIQEIDEFEDSDRFEFEHQISDWSYLDEEGDEGTVTGAEEGDETVNYGGKGGEVVPSLRMLQQRGGSASASASASNGNMFPQQYCLRWKYHHSNLQTMFSQLLERQAYCDVTLACEGQTLRAHKVVLSACSTYFDTILSEYAERDPIVIMRDVKFADIKVLVDFMYKGEINIDHTRLSSLLKTAEDLHIKGLAEVSWRSDSVQNDMSNSGHSPGAATPGVETVLREGDAEESSPPKQRRRGRPPLDDPPSAHDVFTPKVTCVTGNIGSDDTFNVTQEEMMSEGDHESWDGDMVLSENNETPLPVLSYMSKDDSAAPDDKKPSVTSNSNAPNPAIPEQFRDVVKMNDYLTTGRRQEFWEEPFTRRVMDAIKSKELEMKTAAEILGVSYGTLYGRYRDSYGCLKHPYRLDQLEKSGNLKFQKAYEPCSSERVRDFWAEPGPAEVLAKLRRKEITLFRAAEYLNVTVQTLATYLSTLQGPDRLSLSGELAGPISAIDGGSETENDAVNDILQKINANVASVVPNISTATPIKREGGGFVDVPTPITKAATSVLENNPDITIVKTESMPRKREYSKVPNSENNNAKLMSGGGVSELSQQKLSDSLSLNSDNIKP